MNSATKSRRGFACMSVEKRSMIASMGGRNSSGKFVEGSERAKLAGRKGALAQSREAKALGGRHSRRNKVAA